MEHHIVSDIAYAVWQYFTVTGDVGFMYEAGLEIIFETARFWASRAVYNKKIKKYEIKKVIGPDEFHEDVDNSVYTNWMAAWNLKKAKEFYAYFKKRKVPFFERIARKLSLKAGETESWTSLADKMKILKSKNKGIFEEFEGYFKKKDIKLETLNHHFMPALPKGIHLRDFSKTQLVKQADILMLMYLLHGEFSKEEKMRNYIYYVKRTLHKSSLSPSVHAIMASEVGDRIRAYLFFLFSLYADLRDTHGNANSGIHAASLGGTWQAAIMGFSGFRLFENGRVPSFSPRIPGHWKSVAFSLKWRRCTLEVQADNKKINLFVASKKKGFVTIRYFDSPHKITFNQKHVIYKKER